MYYKLQAWVQNPERNYDEGIELLSKLGGKPGDIQFYRQGRTYQSNSMLFNKLSTVLRIAIQNGKLQPQIPSKPIEPKLLPPIHAKKQHDAKLQHNKELTNKLLSYRWEDLSDREKEYFGTEKQFAHKKNLFAEAKEIRKQMSTLHYKMKAATTDDERKEIADQLTFLQKRDISYWQLIDNFGEEVVKDLIKDPPQPKPNNTASYKRLNNLRTYVTKTKKALESASDKDKEGISAKLEAYLKEIAELEKEVNG